MTKRTREKQENGILSQRKRLNASPSEKRKKQTSQTETGKEKGQIGRVLTREKETRKHRGCT
jgi:hypothetical protein